MNMEDFKNLNEIMVKSEEIFDGQVLHLFKQIERNCGEHLTYFLQSSSYHRLIW